MIFIYHSHFYKANRICFIDKNIRHPFNTFIFQYLTFYGIYNLIINFPLNYSCYKICSCGNNIIIIKSFTNIFFVFGTNCNNFVTLIIDNII